MSAQDQEIYDFYIDPETDAPHIYKHNVDEEEALDVLLNRNESYSEDLQGRNDSRLTIGQTTSGRYHKVVYVLESAKKRVFIITAFDLRGNPLTAFKRRKKKHL